MHNIHIPHNIIHRKYNALHEFSEATLNSANVSLAHFYYAPCLLSIHARTLFIFTSLGCSESCCQVDKELRS